ncbi:hypothetical protein INR49_010088 [Caranx melampygus]|nr:hypothetical protein INR49_009307 [Caranx melampygus]KAG7231927.1 hypothetical protein INR49_010088 [Caranx melampygus]
MFAPHHRNQLWREESEQWAVPDWILFRKAGYFGSLRQSQRRSGEHCAEARGSPDMSLLHCQCLVLL